MANEHNNINYVFKGADPVVTMSTLKSVVAGPGNDLGEKGYVPIKYNNDGSMNIDEMLPDISSYVENKIETEVAAEVSSYVDAQVPEYLNSILANELEQNNVYPRLNEKTYLCDGLVNINSKIIENMVVPSKGTYQSWNTYFYGDWEVGSVHKGINWSGQTDSYIEMTTNDSIYALTSASYFEINVYDYMNNSLAKYVTTNITENTEDDVRLDPASSYNNSSDYIAVFISNFKNVSNKFLFKPTFKINLNKIFDGHTKRFYIEIKHVDDGKTFIYRSEDLLYNHGLAPELQNIYVDTEFDESYDTNYKWCSGLKYLSRGTVNVNFLLKKLNFMAAIPSSEIIKFNTDKFDSSVISSNNYNFEIEGSSTWKISIPATEQENMVIYDNGHLSAFNAYGNDDADFEIKALIDSTNNLGKSTPLFESFRDEVFRTKNDFEKDEYDRYVKWNPEDNILNYDDGKSDALMVLPISGLVYPFNNWSTYSPEGSNDYSTAYGEKWFSRTFIGNDSYKFGGIFVFEGLKETQFNNIKVLISDDNGSTWYSLNDVRNTYNETLNAYGIKTFIVEKDGKLFVEWCFPKNHSTNNGLRFKLSMNSGVSYCIRSIRLLSLSGSEVW